MRVAGEAVELAERVVLAVADVAGHRVRTAGDGEPRVRLRRGGGVRRRQGSALAPRAGECGQEQECRASVHGESRRERAALAAQGDSISKIPSFLPIAIYLPPPIAPASATRLRCPGRGYSPP